MRRLRRLRLLPLPPLLPLLLPRLILMLVPLSLLFSAPCEGGQPLLLDERQLCLGRSHWRERGGGKKWTAHGGEYGTGVALEGARKHSQLLQLPTR